MIDGKLQNLLNNFIQKPENAKNNLDLGIYYDNLGQTSAAVSYYLRTAERSSSDLIKYQCILRAGLCFIIQGCRNTTVKGLFQHALALQPKRPEAYFLLSRFYEREANYQDSYLIASIGEKVAEQNLEPLTLNLEYPGFYGILFEKAVSSWWVGLCDESRNIFVDLLQNYDMDDAHITAVKNNLERLSQTNNNLHEVYSKLKIDDNFDWGCLDPTFCEIIKNEIFQDNVYEQHFKVNSGDIVVDIGAAVGAFTYSIGSRNPEHIYCVEPSTNLIPSLKKNTENLPVTIVDRAISYETTDTKSSNEANIYSYDNETFKSITFKKFIEDHNIERIDFLKVDCEGGEIYIFNEENYEFITKNVKNIAIEWHFNGIDNFLEKFKKFRDLYLKDHPNFHVWERCDPPKQINNNIYDDDYLIGFEKWYSEQGDGRLMIYISNEVKQNVLIKENLNGSAWIVDNFYENPNEIRKFALDQEFVEGGFGRGFIGRRTEKQFLFAGIKQSFEKIMGKRITKWNEHSMNGRFQITWSGEPLVYHCDSQQWGGMLYLTPDAPYQCGTTLYAHKQTRARTYHEEGWDAAWKDIPGDPHLDGTAWEPVDVLGNVYNRLVIFDASCIHSASEYFGTVKENARLWQMFFFDT